MLGINRFFTWFIHLFMQVMSSTAITKAIMQRWFGLSLYVQLMFGSGLLLIIVGSAAAFWNISQQEKSLNLVTEQQITTLAKVLTVAGAEELQKLPTSQWRQAVQVAFEQPVIRQVKLKDSNDNIMQQEVSTVTPTVSSAEWLIDALSFVGILSHGIERELVVVPVKSNNGQTIGQLELTSDYRVLHPALIQLFVDNSIQAWFSIFTQMLMVFFLLFLPAMNFRRAVDFAQRIHNGAGETIETNGGSCETTLLIESLNRSSLLFKQQQYEIMTINQGLERKVAERTKDLEIAKRQTEELIEFAPDAMVVSDAQGIILRVNFETERLFGYERSELIGQSLIELIVEDIENDFMEQLHRISIMSPAERAVHNEIYEYLAQNKFGEQVPIAVNFNAITHGEQGSVITVCSIRDITAEKQAKAALQAALEQAKAADQIKTQFLTTMSHEMRTPMNGVLGMAELLGQTGLSEQQNNYLKTILSTGSSLLTIINDILDYTQLESGKAQLKLQPVNIPELVQTVANFMENSAKQKGLEFATAVQLGTVAYLEGDAARLRQVLLHLVSNAIKFTAQGRVCLRVEMKQTLEGEWIRFVVIDTGVGIAQDQIAHIFKSFTQADGTTTRHHDGTGMGLAICAQVAQLMKGQITVESVVGQGSLFALEIPFLPVSEQQIAAMSVSPVAAKPSDIPRLSGHVLLVEDNPVNQKVAVALLKKFGLQVDVANDGVEGVAMWQQNRYDMIFMDCLMPNMDGWEATKEIRRQEATTGAHIPISALTANALEDDRKRCHEAGMDAFVSKPINSGVLAEVARKYLAAC